MTDPTTPATIVEIPLDDLHDSPFNPRRTFTGIDDLAATIKAEGRIHQPLLVRPRVGPLFEGDPDAAAGYEIVFGHRRYRAAAVAGLATAPCMVRSMGDAEARSAQIVENLQRADVHPFEEAEGFAAMIQNDGLSADELAEQLGKSRSYVYARLKLLQACPEVRQACLDGKVGAEVALLIARLRTTKLQEKALAAVRNDTSQAANLEDGGKRSFRHIRDLLAEKFTLPLKGAIFDLQDATLLPNAGACGDCPKRTGNAPEFADLATPERDGEHRHYTRAGGPDLCTDPDCWDAKKTAHLARKAAQLQSEGKAVVTGNKARAALSATGEVKSDYVPIKAAKALKLPKSGVINGVAVPQPVVILNQRDGTTVEAYRRQDLVSAGVLTAESAAAKSVDRHAENQKRHEEQHKRDEARAQALTQQRMALLQAVRQAAAGRERTAFELRMVTAAALGGVDYHDRALVGRLHGKRDFDELKRGVDTLPLAGLTALLLDCAIVDNVRVQSYSLDTKPAPLLALAEHYGIDAQAVMRASAPPADEGTSTPSNAGAGEKKTKAAPAKKTARGPVGPSRAVAYRCPATLQTWSGRGLQPAWLKAALRDGKTLDDFKIKGKTEEVMVKAGSAGKDATSDLFAEAMA